MSLETYSISCPDCEHKFKIRANPEDIRTKNGSATCPNCKSVCYFRAEDNGHDNHETSPPQSQDHNDQQELSNSGPVDEDVDQPTTGFSELVPYVILFIIGFALAILSYRLVEIEGSILEGVNFLFFAVPTLFILAGIVNLIDNHSTYVVDNYYVAIWVITIFSFLIIPAGWEDGGEVEADIDHFLSLFVVSNEPFSIENSKWALKLTDDLIYEMEIFQQSGIMRVESLGGDEFDLKTVENNSIDTIFTGKKKFEITSRTAIIGEDNPWYLYVMNNNCLLAERAIKETNTPMDLCFVRR